MRLHKCRLEYGDGYPFGCVCDVEAELDSSLCRRKWPDVAYLVLHGFVHKAWLSPPWHKYDSRPDHGKSESLFRRSRRSEEHTSELQSLMRISYAVFCLKKKKQVEQIIQSNTQTIIH